MEQLINFLNKVYPLSDGLRGHLLQVIKTRKLAKKAYLLRVGQVCDHVYFIQSGLIRCYYLKGEKDVSSWFMKEGDVVFSVQSFYAQRPSYEAMQALEDTVVFYITYPELRRIYQEFMEFNYIGRTLTEYYYTLSEQRAYALRMQSSRERYAHLLAHHPELVRRVPAKHLASYLGLAEAHLSAIKSKT